MSKFLTPPSWYDKNGSKINIFDNTTYVPSGPFNTAIGQAAIAGKSLSEGNSFGAVAVGSQAHATGPNSIAVGSFDETSGGSSRNVQALATGSIAIGAGAKANADSTDGIAIGRGATSGQGGIAIGAGASAIADQIQLGNNNTAYTLNVGNGTGTINGVRLSASGGVIQLGNNNTAYTLNIGNGTGTLEIGSIKFQKMTITNGTKVSISSRGVYLCCATKNNVSGVAICFLDDLDGNATVLESSTSLCKYVGTDISLGSSVHEIQAYSGVTINYCFKVINVDF